MAIEVLMPLLRLALEPVLDFETAKHQWEYSVASKGLTQAGFDHLVRTGQATHRHWVAYSKQVIANVALALRFVVAGDEKFI